MTPKNLDRIMWLCREALNSAVIRDDDGICDAVTAIGAEFGGAGAAFAMRVWCDTYIDRLGRAGGNPGRGAVWAPSWRTPDGEITRDANAADVSPEYRWAAQFCAARANGDDGMCDALLSAIPGDTAAIAGHVLAVLKGVALPLAGLNQQTPNGGTGA